MSYTVDPNIRRNILNFFKDASKYPTNFAGILRVALFNTSDVQVDTTKVIAWNAPASPFTSIDLSTKNVVFTVPSGTTISYLEFYLYDGTTTYLALTAQFETTYTYSSNGTYTLTDATLSIIGSQVDVNLSTLLLYYLGDSTISWSGFQGITRVALFDSTDTQIDTTKTIAWNNPISPYFSISMSTASVTFSVPINKTLAYLEYYLYNGTTTLLALTDTSIDKYIYSAAGSAVLNEAIIEAI